MSDRNDNRPRPVNDTGRGPVPRDTIAAQLRRRRLAALRCPPLDCGHRDPLECNQHCDPEPHQVHTHAPSDSGLSPAELRAEIQRKRAAGWQWWEIAACFDGREARTA